MRNLTNLCAILAFALIGSTLSSAGQMGTGANIPSADYIPVIFLNKAAVADMHLSPAVQQKETSIIMQEGMSMIGMMQGGGQANRQQFAQKAVSSFKKIQDESLAPLTPAQRYRYRQLSLQFVGPASLLMPKVSSQVGLTPAEIKRLSEAMKVSSKEMAKSATAAQSSAQSDPMGTLQKMRTSQQHTRELQERAAKSILTQAQWQKWNALQGKKLPGIEDLFGSLLGR